MTQDLRIRFIVVLVLAALFGYIVAPIPNKPSLFGLGEMELKKGIDLAGGAELRYRVLFEEGKANKKDLEAATDVIRKRVQAKQLQEPVITSQGDDQIIIQLAGVDRDGLADFKRLIEQAGKLELFATAKREIQEKYNRDKQVPAGYKAHRNAPQGKRQSAPEYAPWDVDTILLRTPSILDGSMVADAKPDQEMGKFGVQWITHFTLNQEGGKRFDAAALELHRDYDPKGMIAIILDDVIQSMPAIQSEKFGGQGQISGAENEAEARELSIILRSGSLPAPVGKFIECPKTPCDVTPSHETDAHPLPRVPESETFVGPTLGEDSIRRGIGASLASLMLVAVFMLIYYRKLGFISVLTLALNMVFLLGIMAFFNATLTLPGIAGIVLTVGMAVDANILIFERIREEQNKGKTASQAFEAGHERAFSTILDANITTLIAAVVLYYFGTGPVRGFAVTLSIGILATLFSVLFCGKTFLRMLIGSGQSEFKMMRLFSSLKFQYMRVARPLIVVSIVVFVGGSIFFFSRGNEVYGIDFKGGTNISFAFREAKETRWVREQIHSIPGENDLPKYGDAKIQTIADPEADQAKVGLSTVSKTFQLRSGFQNEVELEKDIFELFKDHLSHPPFEPLDQEDTESRKIVGITGIKGAWTVYVEKDENYSLEKLREQVSASISGLVSQNAQGKPNFHLEEAPGSPAGTQKLRLWVPLLEASDSNRIAIREKLKSNLRGTLTQDDILAVGTIGPAVAEELKDSTVWAMGIAWVLMILYIAVRFTSWRYGVAAVIALVHDAVIAISFTALAGAVIPEAWGLNFEMNVTTMAAILAIIGYSINDTIVLFDRVRENLLLMKKATFTEIINTSINQTMARTVLTSLTLWLTAIVLYVATMNTGGGIAEFSFPLLIGVIVGTYSSIWVASAVVLWWYRGQRPPVVS